VVFESSNDVSTPSSRVFTPRVLCRSQRAVGVCRGIYVRISDSKAATRCVSGGGGLDIACSFEVVAFPCDCEPKSIFFNAPMTLASASFGLSSTLSVWFFLGEFVGVE